MTRENNISPFSGNYSSLFVPPLLFLFTTLPVSGFYPTFSTSLPTISPTVSLRLLRRPSSFPFLFFPP